MTYEEVVQLALRHPEVVEAMSYGRPSVKRRDKYLFGLQEDGQTISIKLDWKTHDSALAEHPEACYKTPHYETWPAFLVRLEALEPELASTLIEAAWRNAPKPAKRIQI